MDPINCNSFTVHVARFGNGYTAVVEQKPEVNAYGVNAGQALHALAMRLDEQLARRAMVIVDGTQREVVSSIKVIDLLGLCGRVTRTLYIYDGTEWLPLSDLQTLELKGGERFITLGARENTLNGGDPIHGNS